MVKIDFEMTDGTYTLRDAIVLPDNHNFSEAQIEEIKQQRWDNWLKVITTPPEIPNYQLDESGNPVIDENGMPVILENNNG